MAIAGCESTFGRRYPRWSHNLTGHGIYGGKILGFKSIYENIYKTHELIAMSRYYRKYRKTGEIKDLVHVYKGVPPYGHYIRTVKWVFKELE